MSAVQIQSSGSGAGTLTIAAPITATNRTLTLPDQTGTILTGSGAISVNASTPSNTLNLDSSGNVGIGTTTPNYLVDVYKSAGAVSRISSDLSCISIIANASTDTTGPQQQFYKYRGTNASPTIVASGDTVGRVQFYGYDGANVQPAAEIRAVVDNTPGVGDMPGRLVFFTTPDASATVTERMRLDSNGYLLIGYTVSNGAYRLQVNSQIFATSATIATSDRNYKENIVPLTGALSSVCALNPVQFDWKQHPVHDFDRSAPTIGFIAQEVQQTLAERPFLNSIVKRNECVVQPEELAEDGSVINPAVTEEFLGLAESSLVALLTAAIKEQQALIVSLTARIEALEAK